MAAITLALALTLSAPVAQDPVTLQDARCTIALQNMAEAITDPAGKSAVTGVMLFYMGRLSARLRPDQIEGVVNDAGEGFDEAGYRDFALKCVEDMKKLSGAEGVAR